MPSLFRALVPVAIFALALASTAVATPAQDAQTGCTEHHGTFHCDWEQVTRALTAAHTVSIETQPLDRSTTAQLRHLAESLGKTVAAPDQSADLVLSILPIEPNGVDLGPADHPLATLRLYVPAAGTPHGTLLWAESYTGPADRPWPATVHALIQQFQSHLIQH